MLSERHDGVVCTGLIWLRTGIDGWLVNTEMNLRVPQNVGKFFSSCTTGAFSRRAHLHRVSHQQISFGNMEHTNFPVVATIIPFAPPRCTDNVLY
jgi:hypothetical protein